MIVTQPPGYRLAAGSEDVDAGRFERLLGAARNAAGRHSLSAVDLYDQALSLWRGDPYADFAYQDFFRPEISRLEETRLEARAERIEVMLEGGRHAEILGELEALVVKHPLRERFWGQLMTALYREGRQAEALRARSALAIPSSEWVVGRCRSSSPTSSRTIWWLHPSPSTVRLPVVDSLRPGRGGWGRTDRGETLLGTRVWTFHEHGLPSLAAAETLPVDFPDPRRPAVEEFVWLQTQRVIGGVDWERLPVEGHPFSSREQTIAPSIVYGMALLRLRRSREGPS